MSPKLESWIKDFIIYSREQSQKTDFIPDDFKSPCQIDVIWLQDTNLKTDYQIFVFTKWQDVLDLNFELEGPKNISDIINTFDSFIKKDKWTKTLDDETAIGNTYSEALEESFLHFIKNFDQNPFMRNKIRNRMNVAKDCFAWVFDGKIQAKDVKDIFKMVYEHELKDHENSQQEVSIPKPVPAKEMDKGYATFFYPAIWIGNGPNPSFNDRLRGVSLGAYIKNIYTTDYKGRSLIVESDGFLAITETNKEKALDLLNEIMGTALLLKIPNIKIREFELIHVEIDPKTKQIGSWQGNSSFARTRLLEERLQGDPKWYTGHKLFLKENDIVQVIDKSKELNLDTEYTNFLDFFFEAFTHLYNTEYSQSFIMSWTIIEKYLYTLWEKTLKELNKELAQGRKKELLKWNLHPILEIMNLYGELDDPNFKLLKELKSKRNRIVHRGESCSKENAKKCFDLANNLLLYGIQSSKE